MKIDDKELDNTYLLDYVDDVHTVHLHYTPARELVKKYFPTLSDKLYGQKKSRLVKRNKRKQLIKASSFRPLAFSISSLQITNL